MKYYLQKLSRFTATLVICFCIMGFASLSAAELIARGGHGGGHHGGHHHGQHGAHHHGNHHGHHHGYHHGYHHGWNNGWNNGGVWMNNPGTYYEPTLVEPVVPDIAQPVVPSTPSTTIIVPETTTK